jgi:hypothetical protein
MINLELSEEEQQTLISVLEESISDLRREIVHTERLNFKEDLRRKKTNLVHVLEMLKGVAATPAAS